MWNYFNSTRFKIRIAHVVYLVLKGLRFKTQRIIRRKGVYYDINLAEGIELSLFLFGRFQQHVTESTLFKLPQNAVIFDVGANIGSVSLFLAHKYPRSKVFAFEPTDYAYAKLTRNLQLNQKLAERVFPIQSFVSANNAKPEKSEVFSSWRVDRVSGERHAVHMGIAKRATSQQTTIDLFVSENKIGRLDFIKIDTDGNELDVLKGAADSLKRFQPVIVFELSTYLLADNNQSFAEFEGLLYPNGYEIWDGKSGMRATAANLEKIVPAAGSTDLIAIPRR